MKKVKQERMMPTYEYSCNSCHDNFDSHRTIAERKTCPCPNCSGEGVQRISAPNIALDNSFPGHNMKWGRERSKLNKNIKF